MRTAFCPLDTIIGKDSECSIEFCRTALDGFGCRTNGKDTSFTASLTVSVARSAYSFRPSMIASARPSTVVLLSAISSPLCQGSPDLHCLILILHVVNKRNIINISTEQNAEMLRIKS